MLTTRAIFKFIGKGRVPFGLEYVMDKSLVLQAFDGDGDAQSEVTRLVLERIKENGLVKVLGEDIALDFQTSFHHHDLEAR